MTWLSGLSVAGILLIAAFTVGYYTLWSVGISAAVGLIVAYPMGYYISRWIKRDDPNWDHRKKAEKEGVLPDPDAPEV